MANDDIYVLEIKNTTKYNKIFMIYNNNSKENTHEIGMAPPEIVLNIKSLEAKSIELKAGSYSIIEKIPSRNHYAAYNIIIPQGLANEQITETLKKGTMSL
jgi:hypothetical protein